MGRTLYLDCTNGISGDMTVAALLDLGASEEKLRAALASLPLGGYRVEVSRVAKAGVPLPQTAEASSIEILSSSMRM